jgi:hypothetical protein
MGVEDKSLAQQELKKLVEEADAKICPYSHATHSLSVWSSYDGVEAE